jgi:predicted RNA-binding protein associated with RNAse of E/G family
MMIMNPWRRIRQLEEDRDELSDMLSSEINTSSNAMQALEEIRDMANEKSSGTAKRMAKRAAKAIEEINNDY